MKSILKKIIIFILELESKIVLVKYKPKIIAVTGSVGKTSSKDAIFAVLSSQFSARKSQKSFNSEIGVPLTILDCQNAWNNIFKWVFNILKGLKLIIFSNKYPEYLVLEVGADKPGDIKRIARWIRPDISVMTKVSDVPVHVEFFPSPQDLLNEKKFLAKYTKKDGTIILFADDKKIFNIKNEVSQKTMTYGVNTPSDLSGSNYSVLYEDGMPRGMSFKLGYKGNSIPVFSNKVLGSHNIYPFLASSAVGIACGMSILDIVNSFNLYEPSKGRMNIIKGMNDSLIIDDTYNSSPDACLEALNTLDSLDIFGKKIAVLGDMLELGDFSEEEHRKIGERAHQVSSEVIAVGPRASKMPGVSHAFDNSLESIDYIKSLISKGDVVLVKGSQSIRMEHIVKAIMKEPERAGELLVRQEKEWLLKK